MFKIFSKLKNQKCTHSFQPICPPYYKVDDTIFVNEHDMISVWIRQKCTKCGFITDNLIVTESFLPQVHHDYIGEQKREYIQTLRENGVVSEFEALKKGFQI